MENTLNQNKRMDTIDIAKGIGILFVIFAHVNYTPEVLVLIYSFHMPLFFILSGVLFKREKYESFRTFIKRRLNTLILPYIFFYMAGLVYAYVSEQMYGDLFDITSEEYIQYFLEMFISHRSATVINTPLWFVPCLFAVEIMYYFISGLKKKSLILPVCFLLTAFGWLLESGYLEFDNKTLPWSLDSALFALSFYAIGNVFSPAVKDTIQRISQHKQRTFICLGLILICLLIWYPLAVMNGKITLGSKVLNNGFLLYATGILGTMIILAVSLLIKKSRFLVFCGQSTFCIMGVHVMIRKYTLPKMYDAFGIPLYDKHILSECIVPFILVLMITLALTLIYNKVQSYRTYRKITS